MKLKIIKVYGIFLSGLLLVSISSIKIINLPLVPLAIAGAFACAGSLYCQQKNLSLTDFKADPATTVFLFDIHDVIVSLDIIGFLNKALHTPQWYRLLPLSINPSFLYQLGLTTIKAHVAEEAIRNLSLRYTRLRPYVDYFIDVSNEQKPIKSTVKLITKLKQQGYRLYIFSNIGLTAYTRLKTKFPGIFNNFDGIFVPSLENGWLQKPTTQSFEAIFKTLSLEPNQMIFIDDNLENILQARRFNIHGIHYRNATQCIQDLKILGVDI